MVEQLLFAYDYLLMAIISNSLAITLRKEKKTHVKVTNV